MSLFLVLELVPQEGTATGAGLEGAAVEVRFSLGALVEEEVCEEEAVLSAVMEEVEGRMEARLGVGFRVGGAKDGVVGRDSGFMSHLDRFPAGLLKSGSSLFLFIPVAPSSCFSSSPLFPSHGAGASHWMP